MSAMNETDIQKWDLALPYIITSIDVWCETSVHQLRCPAEAWSTLKENFQAVSEEVVD